MLFYFNQLKSSWFVARKNENYFWHLKTTKMADQSVEKNIQFSLEAIDLDEDIEMTDELFCNEDVEEDCVLSEEDISSFDLLLSPFSFIFPNLRRFDTIAVRIFLRTFS